MPLADLEERRKYNQSYAKKNKKKLRAACRLRMRKWRKENKEKLKATRDADKKRNPKKWKEIAKRDHEALMNDPVRLEKKRASARATQFRYMKENHRKWLSGKLRRAYGITIEEYDKLLIQQRGLCAICRGPETCVVRGKVIAYSVDHCHDSKKVRGLLCSNCNNGLGRFKDNPQVLRQAVAYLERV